MKIYVSTDHAGFGIKEKLVPFLISLGHDVEDMGAYEYNDTDDYPDFVIPVARQVSLRPNDVKGIILGGSGEGEAMCANRYKHVRATVYYGKVENVIENVASILTLSREHNDANILAIGARFLTKDQVLDAVKEWLDASFTGEERHKRRIAKMDNIHE